MFGWTDNGEVDAVSIDGKMGFTRGDVFPADSEIIITYHMPMEENPNKEREAPQEEGNSAVFYSTNDYETAKCGNSGVFAYKEAGANYDIYWIIDFDEGYVYEFMQGNMDSTCDRVKIVSGTLNDNVIITYHDSEYEWSYSLHFKHKEHPETLVMIDRNGFDYIYAATDLVEALSIRNTKTIYDF